MAKISSETAEERMESAVRENDDKKTEATSQNKPASKGAPSLIARYKKLLIGAGGVLIAVILLLVIINPANSPSSVFNRYLDCLRAENESLFTAVSYDAQFSNTSGPEAAAEQYRLRFSSADDSYKSGGNVNLLKDTDVRIIKQETPKKDEMASSRTALAESHRNTTRITDIRDITFEVKRGDQVTTGTAEMICVTGKWYVGEVNGI